MTPDFQLSQVDARKRTLRTLHAGGENIRSRSRRLSFGMRAGRRSVCVGCTTQPLANLQQSALNYFEKRLKKVENPEVRGSKFTFARNYSF